MYSFLNLEQIYCSMSDSSCCFLTCIQISQEVGKGGLVFPSLGEFSRVFCDPHSQRLWHSQWSRSKCFSVILSLFPWSSGCWRFDLWLRCLFKNPAWTSGNCWFHVLLKSSLKDFEHYLARLWNENNCMVVWTFFGIAFLWDWNENWPFPVLRPLLSFPILLALNSTL